MTRLNAIDHELKRLTSSLILPGCELSNRLALAPLAGATDVIYRTLCREQGAGLVVSELVSARGIVYDSDFTRNYRYLEIEPQQESPVSIQLFGQDPHDFAQAIRAVLEHPLFGQCSLIDLNLGCPVNKVVRQGAGSALMRDPERAGIVMTAAVQAAAEFDKSVSVKIRSGWDRTSLNAVDIARRAEQAGIQMITVHARTREQMYQGKADWSVIRDVVRAVKIPVFGNGDVVDRSSCFAMLRETGCAGVMIGRAALGNPWIFGQILNGAEKPDECAWIELIERHLKAAVSRQRNRSTVKTAQAAVRSAGDECNSRLEAIAVREMRTHLAAYLKGRNGAAEKRRKIMNCEKQTEILEILGS